ncbi:MAG TPA: efflux RND transporter permease subunit [Steroidobacteraceae bacterium]|nr:efflux RND transporter permease subunit [Steroidobacteraceae bacterium]
MISDLSVRRPVFATVMSLLLFILGIGAITRLSLREFPDVERPVVNIETRYRGASSDVVESRITQIIENEISGIEGVERLNSSSRDERSQINVEFTLERDLDSAANDVRERLSRVAARLPLESDPPQITKVDSAADPIIFLNVASTQRSVLELTDYMQRYLVDQFSTLEGVASVRMNGARRYAMRVWLSRENLAARQLTVADVENSLLRENVEIPAGRLESREREFSLRTDTNLRTEEDFRALVVGRGPDGYLVRLGEVAEVRLASDDDRSLSRSNGAIGLSMGIIPQSKANVLATSKAVKQKLAEIQKTLPADIKVDINIDNGVFIEASLKNVVKALTETLVLVLIVIFLFLGTVRATLIPAVTIPVSIIAAAIVMATLGYSINTLTLLAAVLAIGLVVDDAIVVLENIVRRVEQGEPAVLASITGAREIGFAVIATTLVLMAVFVPVSFMTGDTGRLFGEFGVTVAAAVGFSAFVALSLTPMMTSKLFANGMPKSSMTGGIDRLFHNLDDHYAANLRSALAGRRPLYFVAGSLAIFGVLVLLLVKGWPFPGLRIATELAPQEDRAFVRIFITAPEGSSIQYLDRQLRQVEAIAMDEVANGNARRVNVRTGGFGRSGDVSTGMVILPLNLWDQRDESAGQISDRLRQRTQDISGARINVNQASSPLTRNSTRPLAIAMGGGDYAEIVQWRDKVMQRVAAENPRILNLESDYLERQPRVIVQIDRNKAADLGVSLQSVGRTLETMLGSRIVTTFERAGEEYDVMLQARDTQRASIGDLDNLYVRSDKNGELLPLSAMVRIDERAGPTELRRTDRMRAIELAGSLAPGYALGDAVEYMEKVIHEEAPNAQIIYNGETYQYKKSGDALWITFAFALLVVYLVLAAQFESFIHPIVILVTVPLALTGAMLGLFLFNSTINIFSQIGCIMLIGIACKNGILIVEFANQLRDRGVEFFDAVIQSSATRLRPVLMTSLCTAFGAVPLMLAHGAGAESRMSIGATVFFGTVVSLGMTLYVVPALYLLIARNTRSPEYMSRLVDSLTGRDKAGDAAAPGAAARESGGA